jgi:hypothetical protein
MIYVQTILGHAYINPEHIVSIERLDAKAVYNPRTVIYTKDGNTLETQLLPSDVVALMAMSGGRK